MFIFPLFSLQNILSKVFHHSWRWIFEEQPKKKSYSDKHRNIYYIELSHNVRYNFHYWRDILTFLNIKFFHNIFVQFKRPLRRFGLSYRTPALTHRNWFGRALAREGSRGSSSCFCDFLDFLCDFLGSMFCLINNAELMSRMFTHVQHDHKSTRP